MRTLQFILPICLVVGFSGCGDPERPPPRSAHRSARFAAVRLFEVIRVQRGDNRACTSTGGRFLPSLNPDDKHRISGDLFYRCNPVHFDGKAEDAKDVWRLQLHLTCNSSEPVAPRDLQQMGGFACKHGDWGVSWETIACRDEADCQRTDPIKGGKRIGEGRRWSPGEAKDYFSGDSLPAMVW